MFLLCLCTQTTSLNWFIRPEQKKKRAQQHPVCWPRLYVCVLCVPPALQLYKYGIFPVCVATECLILH